MAKELWKPGNMLYPLPVVMVSMADKNGKTNIITIAWAGTVCTNPPMVSISVRPERYSYPILKETGEFCYQSDNKGACLCYGLLRGKEWQGCGQI